MSGRFSISLLSAFALSQVASALVPADPTITSPALLPKRQNNDQFIGWLEVEGSYYSETCNAGLTWYQDTKYAQCCPATLASCYAPTACVGGSLIYPYTNLGVTRTIACTENYDNTKYSICNTAFIFENINDSSPKTDIICGENSVNWSYYRKVPASATDVVSSAMASSIPQVVSTADTAPTEAAHTTNKKTKSKSKAWIAGAVVGPLAGLAIIAGAILAFLRRRKNKKNTTIAPQTGGAAMAQTDPSQPPPGVGGYTDAKPQPQVTQQPYGQPDPYAQQGAYNAQQGYAAAPTSPAPQYNTPAQYNAPAPYTAPGSPPPQAYQSDTKYGYAGVPASEAAELGGNSHGIAPVTPTGGAAPTPPVHHAAELGGDNAQHQQHGNFGGAELPANTANNPRY